jgi:hypothetical protein
MGLPELLAALCVLFFAWRGARMGLKAAAIQTLAAVAALLSTTALVPLLSGALADVFNPLWVWSLGGLLLFMLLAIGFSRVFGLLVEPLPVPAYLRLPGGALIMAAVGCFLAGVFLWAGQLMTGLSAIAKNQPLPPAKGVYAWANQEMGYLVQLSARASYSPAPQAAWLGAVAQEPAVFMQQILALARAEQLQEVFSDADAQLLMAQGQFDALLALPSVISLLESAQAQDLLKATQDAGFEQPNLIFARYLARVWRAKTAFTQDSAVQELLADGMLLAQLQEGDTLSLLANPSFRAVCERLWQLIRQEPSRHTLHYRWISEDGHVQYSQWQDIPEKFRAQAQPVKQPPVEIPAQ